jgi:hypothetical protein
MFDIQPTKSPFNPVVTTVQTAMQDAAVFHGVLALFACVWANIQGSALQLETIYHKVECVRILKSRLNKCEPPSEGTICAVMWLWGLEVRTHKSCKTLIAN